MGRWFAGILSKDGKEVVITGRNEEKLREAGRQLGVEATSRNEAAVSGADYVLLSVPVESLEAVVKELGPHLAPGQAVIDISSVKVAPLAIMHRHLKTGPVLGAHPLFGPGARGIANQNFVLTPTSEPEQELAQRIKNYLEGKGARVTLMTPGEHDEVMSVILGLSHFIAIVAGDALLGTGMLPQAAPVAGTTYRVLLTLVASVLSEDPELYASLQMNLPRAAEWEKRFQSQAGEWADLVAAKDRAGFARRMKALKESLQRDVPDFGQAYQNMYRIVEGL